MSFLGTYNSRLGRDEAMKMLRSSWRGLNRGRLSAITELSLPYHLFEVTVPRRGKALLAIDALDGHLDLHRFESLSVLASSVHPENDSTVAIRLSVDLALERIIDQTLRMVFLEGFFKRAKGAIETHYVGILNIPYWIGIFERDGQVKLEVIDAYRGRFEGHKMRQVVAAVLAERAREQTSDQ